MASRSSLRLLRLIETVHESSGVRSRATQSSHFNIWPARVRSRIHFMYSRCIELYAFRVSLEVGEMELVQPVSHLFHTCMRTAQSGLSVMSLWCPAEELLWLSGVRLGRPRSQAPEAALQCSNSARCNQRHQQRSCIVCAAQDPGRHTS